MRLAGIDWLVFWSLLLFRRLFRLPTWADAISSGSVSPHLKPFRGPTECLLANVSLFLSAQSPRSPDTYSPHPAESARHTEFDTQGKKKTSKNYTCTHSDVHMLTLSHRRTATRLFAPIQQRPIDVCPDKQPNEKKKEVTLRWEKGRKSALEKRLSVVCLTLLVHLSGVQRHWFSDLYCTHS